jgi:hypothetical protein
MLHVPGWDNSDFNQNRMKEMCTNLSCDRQETGMSDTPSHVYQQTDYLKLSRKRLCMVWFGFTWPAFADLSMNLTK